MSKFVVVFALLLAAVAVSADSNVKVLTADNFDDGVKETKLTLVEFYAPWCGHCKSLAPEYEKAADELAGDEWATLAKVDCTEHRDLCSKYGVRGFPTLKLFTAEGGEPSDYDSARKTDALVKFMKTQNRPAVSELTSDVSEFVKAEGGLAVVAFAGEDANLDAFQKVAAKLRNKFVFASTASAAEAKEHAVDAPAVKMFRDFDDGAVTFDGDVSSAEALEAWITEKSFPLIGEIGPDNYKQYVDRGLSFFWLFVDYKDEAQTALVNNLADVAKSVAGKLSVVKLDGVRWVEHGKNFGWNGETPGLVIEDSAGDSDEKDNYIFDGEATKEAVQSWVDDFVAGKLKPHVKSEPIPESNDGDVKVVVALQFDEIVKDESKNVFVEFYAPWCGHCKSLAPKWDDLGAKYANDDAVVIAKMDATANKAPSSIRGFPTLIFYPAGADKAGIPYEGAREVDALAAFVEEKRTGGAAAADAGGDAGDSHQDL